MKNIDPRRNQFEEFKSLPRDQPIMMMNLIRLNGKARYHDKRDISGAEAYEIYGKESKPCFQAVGGKVIWRGKPECMLIGPIKEYWDIAFIAQYPDASAFLKMVTDPTYQAVVFHRQAAVEDSRLIRFGQTEEILEGFI